MKPKKIKQLELFEFSEEQIKFLKMINEMADIKDEFSFMKYELLNLRGKLQEILSSFSLEDQFLTDLSFKHDRFINETYKEVKREESELDEVLATEEDTVH